MDAGWFFVIASLIAVIGVVVAFKQLVHQVGEMIDRGDTINEGVLQAQMTRFFMKVAIIEAIPIILIVLGFMQIGESTGDSNQMIPLTIILLIFVFGIINVMLSKNGLFIRKEIDSSTRSSLNMLNFIGIAFVSSVPLISVIALMM